MNKAESAITVSVVLPVRNGEQTIGAQLAALRRQSTERHWELIVVDNGSTDQTASSVVAELEHFRSGRLIDASQAVGASFAKNRGASVAEGAILLFCDADDEVDEDWIENLAGAVTEFGFVGGSLDRRRLHTGHSDGPGRPITTELHLTDDGQPFAVGANLGMSAELFRRIGGFDAAFLGGNEDADIGIRAGAAGCRPTFCADAVVHYRERSTMGATFHQYRLYGRTEAQLYCKHRATLARRSTRKSLRLWMRLFRLMLRGAREPLARVLATRLFGRGVGRIEGSIRHRVLFL